MVANTFPDVSHTTNGLVCSHHHLYSTLARGMPAPPKTPTNFLSVLEQVWWRLDAALDLNIIYWSAALGAAEALLNGTTAIIDHHESPFAIEGSLHTIKQACDMIGMRTNLCYGITDRWRDDNSLQRVTPSTSMTDAARRGLQENIDFLQAGGNGMIGVHASFTCGDETLNAAAEAAEKLNVGVHIHVAEGKDDISAGERLESLSRDNWLLVHGVYLDRPLKGFLAHNPRSNMNNSVGYAEPATKKNTVVLGTDGIGADMLEEFRLAYVRHRESDITATPETSWKWLQNGELFFPEVRTDTVSWTYDSVRSPWHLAFTPGVRCTDVVMNGEHVVSNGVPTKFDINEVRAKAAEAAHTLHQRLA